MDPYDMFNEYHGSSRGLCCFVLSHGQLLGRHAQKTHPETDADFKMEFQSWNIFTQLNKITTSSQCSLTKIFIPKLRWCNTYTPSLALNTSRTKMFVEKSVWWRTLNSMSEPVAKANLCN